MHFLFIHGTGGGPNECWYPWLADVLQKKKHSVIAPRFPTPNGQTLDNWLTTMQPYWKVFDSELVLIGRSIGVPFALRLLEKSPAKIKAAFLIAGFCSDLGLEEFAPVVDSFIAQPFQWEKIRTNCEKFFVYGSDNDPFIPFEKVQEVASNLKIKPKMVKGVEHFWFDTFEEILPDIASLGIG